MTEKLILSIHGTNIVENTPYLRIQCEKVLTDFSTQAALYSLILHCIQSIRLGGTG